MSCNLRKICGGCPHRDMDEQSYRQMKEKKFLAVIQKLNSKKHKICPSIFIKDGSRRRATFAFEYKKNKLILGFNEESSHKIVDVPSCPLLTPEINKCLTDIRRTLTEICCEKWTEKKGKKILTKNIAGGDIFICEADNGLDIVLETSDNLVLNHRMIISEFVQQNSSVIRFSHRTSAFADSETIVEKTPPLINIGQYKIYIPAGTFLQPSKAGQEALGKLVVHYLKGIKGKVADLFCGVGTFSYLLALENVGEIISVDSSKQLLSGFKDSVNKNQIKNITIQNKNLFKYPLDENELKGLDAVLFDPPRAGAKAQCLKIAESSEKPRIIVAVSCNPQTFVNDADILISGGYDLKEITLVDQFIYSNHSELVAFFTKRNM